MSIAHDLGLNAGRVVHRTSITDPQVIARVTTQLDHLGPFPKGPFKCPKDDGETFVLTFARREPLIAHGDGERGRGGLPGAQDLAPWAQAGDVPGHAASWLSS